MSLAWANLRDHIGQSAAVQDMIRRVDFYEAEEAGYGKMASLLRVLLKDGRVLGRRAGFRILGNAWIGAAKPISKPEE